MVINKKGRHTKTFLNFATWWGWERRKKLQRKIRLAFCRFEEVWMKLEREVSSTWADGTCSRRPPKCSQIRIYISCFPFYISSSRLYLSRSVIKHLKHLPWWVGWSVVSQLASLFWVRTDDWWSGIGEYIGEGCLQEGRHSGSPWGSVSFWLPPEIWLLGNPQALSFALGNHYSKSAPQHTKDLKIYSSAIG